MPTILSTDEPRALLPGGAEDLIWGKFQWGEYASTASLPNVADDGKDVAAGDLACVGGRTYECASPTSGAATWFPVAPLTHPTRVFTMPVNANAADLTGIGTDAAAAAATDLDYVEIFVPHRMTCTGAACLNGTTVGTNKVRYLLFNSAGTFVIGTATAGTTGSGQDVFQQIAWTAPVTLAPGKYFLGFKCDGTTHQNQRASAGSPMLLCEREGGHTFAGNANITSIATTFTADRAPIGYLY